MQQKKQGFTLVEMAIVIVIMGLIAGTILSTLSSRMENTKIETTRTLMDNIQRALNTFMVRHHRLPCPANPDLSPDKAEYGLEQRGANTCNNMVIKVTKTSNIDYIGILPWRTLHLKESAAIDAWKRRFTYRVNYQGVKDNAMQAPKIAGDEFEGAIRIYKDSTATMPVNTEKYIYLVMSHGKNGYGAYLPNGTKMPVAKGDNEKENIDINNFKYIDADYSSNENNPFDDILFYYSGDQILIDLMHKGESTIKSKDEQLRQIFNEMQDTIYVAALADMIDPDGTAECVSKTKSKKLSLSYSFSPGYGSGCINKVNKGCCQQYPTTSGCCEQYPEVCVITAPSPATGVSGYCGAKSLGTCTGKCINILRSVRHSIPSVDQLITRIDPWGSEIVYIPDNKASSDSTGIDVGVYSNAAEVLYMLVSCGKDKSCTTTSIGPCSGDDVCILMKKATMVSKLSESGTGVD